MAPWTIGVEAWIIQDGNYRDFSRGQECDFAVEAVPEWIARDDRSAREASPRTGATYAFSGVLVFSARSAWVIDLGLLCYGNCPMPEGASVGDGLSGESYLGIEGPGIYEQAFFTEAPPLTYSWRVERIRLETTPWIEIGPRSFKRDATQAGFADVEATDAWNDDGGHGHYLLDCRLLDPRPH